MVGGCVSTHSWGEPVMCQKVCTVHERAFCISKSSFFSFFPHPVHPVMCQRYHKRVFFKVYFFLGVFCFCGMF